VVMVVFMMKVGIIKWLGGCCEVGSAQNSCFLWDVFSGRS
jgi:hypothetical protein